VVGFEYGVDHNLLRNEVAQVDRGSGTFGQ
jgi:hypothetical protein